MTYCILNKKRLPWCTLEDLVIEDENSKETYHLRKKRTGFKTVISIIPNGYETGEIRLEYNPIWRALYLGSIKIFVNGEFAGRLRRGYPMYSGLVLQDTGIPYEITGNINAHSEIRICGEDGLANLRYTFNPENKLISPAVIARFHVHQAERKHFFIALATALLVTPRDTVSP